MHRGAKNILLKEKGIEKYNGITYSLQKITYKKVQKTLTQRDLKPAIEIYKNVFV
jgi:hypothetical protein